MTDLPLTYGLNAIVTIVDRLIKWITLFPCKMGHDHPVGVEEVALVFFHNIVYHFGVPHSLVDDRDAQSTSEFWTRLCYLVVTRICFSFVHHP